MNKLLVNVCCWFIPKKKNKRHFRDKFKKTKEIKDEIKSVIVRYKNNENIIRKKLIEKYCETMSELTVSPDFLNNPSTYNEKLQWLKLYDDIP